jgi:hypothetical protein
MLDLLPFNVAAKLFLGSQTYYINMHNRWTSDLIFKIKEGTRATSLEIECFRQEEESFLAFHYFG